MKTYNIGVIPGDGIGPDVAAEGLKVLRTVMAIEGFDCNLVEYPYSGEYYLKTKELVPERVIDEWRTLDAVFLGAIGHPDVEPGLVERSVILGLRFGLDLYINLRPVKLYAPHLTPLKDKQPEDMDFVVVREKNYDGTKSLFQNMLTKKDVPDNYQASAHYYLGFIAWLEGDVDEVRSQGDQVLRVEPEGGFASIIKQLMETSPPRRLGLNVTAGLDSFYVDNVELKPTYRTATKGNSRTTGINVALGMTWNFRHHIAANYNFGGTLYSKRPDLDLGLHMVGITWADQGLQVGPRYEFVTMYNKMLYKGIGVDLGWGNGSWTVVESVRYKTFTRGVRVISSAGKIVTPPPSLANLGGWSNSFMLMRMASWRGSTWMFGTNFAFERTKGAIKNRVNNHKTTDYNQIGGSINLLYPDGELLYSADVNGYIKRYRGIDPAVINAKRKDEYIHFGAGVTWSPAEHKPHALSLKTEWNNNNSNYDFPNSPTLAPNAAAYSQWKHTIGYAYSW
ncbi:MAG: isocitrate/isopropylmalate family dehydrogenase [Mariprofundales bacterium]|nr:isocitrate/isopropylmalate family dehydrogenase [Mariprofundales bacterium]